MKHRARGPELAPEAAAANLRKAVHYARRALDGEGSRLIASVGELLCLPADGVWIDVEALRTAAAQASASNTVLLAPRSLASARVQVPTSGK